MSRSDSRSADANILLRAMPDGLWQQIEAWLQPVDLPLRFVLERPKLPILHVYFPLSGIASTVASVGRDKSAEVGIYGIEGMSGLPIIMGGDLSMHHCFMQVPGEGLCIASDRLVAAMDAVPDLRVHFLRFAQAMMLQTAQTAAANARTRLEERLCRWLLMSHDRIGHQDLPLTHEFLALMLGVRRAGVTTALQLLEGRGLVDARRGMIRIIDREGLEVVAGASYGQSEDGYRRLLGIGLREAG
jgi:CRP-like cAMP-binding protein